MFLYENHLECPYMAKENNHIKHISGFHIRSYKALIKVFV